MIGQRIKGLGAAIPPLLQDAALALVLGLVGAAQLISDSHIFRGPPRHSLPGGGLGPTLGPGRVGGPGAGGNPAGPGGPAHFGPVHADFLTYLLLGLCAASLIIRRRYPLLSLAGVTFFGAAFPAARPACLHDSAHRPGRDLRRRRRFVADALRCGWHRPAVRRASLPLRWCSPIRHDATRSGQWTLPGWSLRSSSAIRCAAGEPSPPRRSAAATKRAAAVFRTSACRSPASCTTWSGTTSR